jgi:light-harvesting complex II chlorophyll a/b binding protein 4
MLCAVGWPLAELWHPTLAKIIGGPGNEGMLAAGGRAPSVLNGGLESFIPFFVLVALGTAGGEFFTVQRRWKSGDPSYYPGDVGFDPLELYSKVRPSLLSLSSF